MSKNDFAKRLKRMVQEQRVVVKMESEIARQSATHYEQLFNMKTAMTKQKQELSFYRNEVEKLKDENTNLQKYKKKEEERLCDTIRRVEQMQSEYESIKQKQIEQRHTALMQMDCLRSFKEATQTYINIEALPQMIQGVTICDRASSRDWKPFCIDPSKHTHKEVQNKIWHDTQIDSVHKETWEKLVMR